MPQIFHRSFNTISRVTIFGAVFILAGLGWGLSVVARSSYVTNMGITRAQPIPFSHEHHVNGLGIDCRYCHRSVEQSAYPCMPANQSDLGKQLAAEYKIEKLLHCSTCHR